MDRSELSRREFQKLTGAALGGLFLGAGMLSSLRADDDAKDNPLLGDSHVCRGINTCKGKGADKKNDCAGKGTCAIAEAHTCHAANACKGQGGCGEHPGENACKAMGACAVPLKDDGWKKARGRFEELMKAQKKTFGDAPAKKS